MLIRRGNSLRISLFGLFSAILGFILTSFLIFSAYLFSVSEFYSAAIVTFSLGLLLLIVGVLFAIREVAVSYAAVVHETRGEQY